MFTSRAEHRLVLRYTNANKRLCAKARDVGLIKNDKYRVLREQSLAADKAVAECSVSVSPKDLVQFSFLSEETLPSQKLPLKTLIKRPGVLLSFFENIYVSSPQVKQPYRDEVFLEADTMIKYKGYIKRSNQLIEKLLASDGVKLISGLDYGSIPGLSAESREKLLSIKPETLGQAMRVSGVTPADISILSIFNSKLSHVSRET